MKIRHPSAADHSAWLSMRTALWPHCSAEKHLREIAEYTATSGRMAAFIAVDGPGLPCGFAEAVLRDVAEGCGPGPTGYLEGIYVLPEYRGGGIGRMLVREAERWAASRGCREMASDCLHDHTESILFHRKVGFEVTHQLVHFRRSLANHPEDQ